LEHDSREHPLVLQLGGNDPEKLKMATLKANDYNFDEINLNVGCPSIETGGAHYGASLMLQPLLTKHLMESIAEVILLLNLSVLLSLITLKHV
jgi:tRNA-dihydrouridine synthase A